MNIQRLNRSKGPCAAFSLVEVVLAIGIVSFAVLSVLALLPQGILTVQNAETLQATSNIATQLRGEMKQLSFAPSTPSSQDSIQALSAAIYYYTTDGIPTTDPTTAYYKATFTISNINASPFSMKVVDASFNANNAQNVQVTLAYPPAIWNKTYVFSLLVARETDN